MNASDAAGNGADEAFLLVRIGARPFALPAAQVLEIVAAITPSPLPFAPPWVAGIANISGRVLPLLDPAVLLGIAAPEGDRLVLVNTTASPCALRVNAVLARVQVAADALHRVEPPDGHVVAEFEHDGEPVLVLDCRALGSLLGTDDMPAGTAGLLGALEEHAGSRHDDSLPCLVFLAGRQRYAMALDEVGEVIEAPALTPVPGAPAIVAGIGMLRDDPLLFVSLTGVLGIADAPAGAALVVQADGLRIGLLVDGVEAVTRFAATGVRPLDSDDGVVSAVIHDDAGHITGLLARARLLAPARRQQLLPLAPAARRQDSVQARVLLPHLEVCIGDERFGIPLPDVQRIVRWSAPETLDSDDARVAGAVNVDGRIVPVLAATLLQRRAGDSAAEAWVLVGHDADTWALAVQEARRIIQVPQDSIEKAGGDNPLLRGLASIDEQLLSLVDLQQARSGSAA